MESNQAGSEHMGPGPEPGNPNNNLKVNHQGVTSV